MSAAEIAEFEALEHYDAACRLRRYDDIAKDPDVDPSDLERYRPLLLAALRRDQDGSRDVP